MNEIIGETDKTVLPPERVIPDLELKLPGLFGADAPRNTISRHVRRHDAVYTPSNTHWPLDFVGVSVRTGQRMDPIGVQLRTWAPGYG